MPLLFCIGLNPLSQIINKSSHGYKLRNGETTSHLLCTDDIKLYAKNKHDIGSLIHLTRIYKLDKYGRMVSRRGKMIRSERVELPEGNTVDVQDSDKYLANPTGKCQS